MRILTIILVSLLFLSGCASSSGRMQQSVVPLAKKDSTKNDSSALLDDVRSGAILNLQIDGFESPQQFVVEKSYFSALGGRCFIGRVLPDLPGKSSVTLCADAAGGLKPAAIIKPLAIQP